MSNRLLLFIIAIGISTLADPCSAVAQEPGLAEQPWEASVRYDYDRVSGDRKDWQRWTISLKRDVPRGTIMASFDRQRRFGVADAGGAVDVWQDLWSEAYGHLRVGLGPNTRIRSQRTVRADLHQSIGAWEVSGQYSWRHCRTERRASVRARPCPIRRLVVLANPNDRCAVPGNVGRRSATGGATLLLLGGPYLLRRCRGGNRSKRRTRRRGLGAARDADVLCQCAGSAFPHAPPGHYGRPAIQRRRGLSADGRISGPHWPVVDVLSTPVSSA